MIGLIERTDSFGDVQYFTIIGANESSLFDQMSELNEHAWYCDTGNRFRLIGHKIGVRWFDNVGKLLDNSELIVKLKEEGVI
ncbi:MAG: hypothetical protein II282_08050 [Alistipes sp.]|nr:hypothetical protein [Alistipes sp.]